VTGEDVGPLRLFPLLLAPVIKYGKDSSSPFDSSTVVLGVSQRNSRVIFPPRFLPASLLRIPSPSPSLVHRQQTQGLFFRALAHPPPFYPTSNVGSRPSLSRRDPDSPRSLFAGFYPCPSGENPLSPSFARVSCLRPVLPKFLGRQ